VTLAFALAVSSVGLNSEYVHWLPVSAETSITRTPFLGRIVVQSEDRYYYFCLVMLLVSIVMVRGLRRSRTGRVLIGVRENQRAAQAFGVNATTAKLTAFAISGFIAAMAGGLFVHHQEALGITAYQVPASRDAFIMVVIGGLGSIPGAILGAVFIEGVGYFRTAFPEALQPYTLFLTTGVGLIFVLLLIPGGFSQVLYDLRDRGLRKVAERRGILVPSLVADARADLPPGFEPETDVVYEEPTVELDVQQALTTAALAGVAAGEVPEADPVSHGNDYGNGNGRRTRRRDAPLVAAGRDSDV
jgi:branched-chain amino acid transport system permease protein